MSIVPDYTINVHQGETWSIYWLLTDENTAIVDLTGYTAICKVKDRPNGNTLLDFATGGTASVTGASGKSTLSLTAAQSAALKFQNGWYDWKLVKTADGSTDYYLKGKFIVTPSISG
jgi:hypothetical protein